MAPIVQSLNEEWAVVADSPAARRALMRWAARNPVLDRVHSVNDLVDTRARPSWGDAVHRVLASEAASDQIAARTLLQALLGGLICMSHRVGRGDPDAIDELVSLAWARICTYPTHRRGTVASNVLMDVQKQYRRAQCDEELVVTTAVFDRADHAPSPERVVCAHEVVDELVAARDCGLISGSELATVIRTRVGGESLVALAAERGISADATWRERTRAEHRLRSLPLAG